jgi:hypothetical protein
MTGATTRFRDKKNMAVIRFGLNALEFNPEPAVVMQDDMTRQPTEPIITKGVSTCKANVRGILHRSRDKSVISHQPFSMFVP